MTTNTPEAWEETQKKTIYAILDKMYFNKSYIDCAFEDIRSLLHEVTHCHQPVENGEAICGVKLNCHLHDWRQNDMEASWQREAKVELLREVSQMFNDLADVGLEPALEKSAIHSLAARHGITEDELNQKEV